MPDPQPSWRLHKTPNPAERSISLTVPMTEIAENTAAFDAFVEDSLFKNFPLIPEPSLAQDDQFGLYKYKDCDDAPNGAALSFMFVKTKTPKQRNTPFRRKRVSRRVDWDAVLEWIEFGIDSGFPLSQTTFSQGKQAVVTADRWLVPRGYRPAQNLMTVVDIEQFLSDVPYAEYLMESDEPQPGEVMWDLTGSHGTTGRVLHDTVPVPAQSSAGYRVISSVGAQSSNATGTKQWIFPKTNHKNRREYEVISVEYVAGQYLKERYIFHPPTPSKIIQQS